MEYPKEILVKDYFEIHNYYSKIYGNNTFIMMQVGSFHEAYCTDTDGLDLIKLSQQLDVVCTKKNGKEAVSKGNPRMLGFPTIVKESFIEKLCNLNFTVILIDQTSEPPKPKREVTGIYSSSTFIDAKSLITVKTNFLVSIVIDKKSSISNQLCIGICSYDLSTGYGSFYETYSKENDLMLALDDTIRYLETCPPREVILQTTINHNEQIANMSLSNILGYLGLENNMIFNVTNKLTNKISYQSEIFNKVFPNEINIFEKTNLHKYNWARLALTNLFDYTKNHQEYLLTNLKFPNEFTNDKYLYLGNHALEQLDVFINNSNEKGLFDIINNTKTLIGKRYLKLSLSQPLIKSSEIDLRLKLIEKLLNNDNYSKLSNLLEDISDLERLIRRMEIGSLHPFELNLLYLSCYQINKIIDFSTKNNLFNLNNKHVNINNLNSYIEETFEINNLVNLNFSNFVQYDNTLFKPNKYKDIDELSQKIVGSSNFMDNLVTLFSEYIDDKKSKGNDLLTLKYNDREGHYLLLTSRRCELLRNKIDKLKELKVGSIILEIKDFEFTPMPKSNYIKITCNKMKNISDTLVGYKLEMAKLTQRYFKEELLNITSKFGSLLNYWSQEIGFIDFINSGAICAITNHYSKPTIVNQEPDSLESKSFLNAKKMRHPIVEYISKEYEYKPQTISLNGNGILLYGINSSGKSTLMKSIGLNVILAQIGYYVAAESFELNPYKSLFTRISGNDNLHRGLSSFMVEMIELTSILKRNNQNTLMIGDEICRGTDLKSSEIIVTYMLQTLSEAKTSFITATHLHDLTNIQTVKQLKNLSIKHLKITFDEINDKLIFDRELLDGQGDSFYGLTVAKYLMKDKHFNEVTSNILKEVTNIDVKQSKYNSDNYLSECKICKSTNNLESHHIVFQKEFDEKKLNKNKLHYQKDANYNLVTLCSKCHDDVDRHKILINGWVETSNGRELDYEIIQEKPVKQSKYNDELINYIKNLKKETLDPKMAQIKIKEQFNKKLTSKTILSFW